MVLRDGSVSRCHAEVVCLPEGRIHVADRATGSGTFVRRGDEWHPIRQALLDPGDVLRFGACTITAGELGALCVRGDASPSEQATEEQPGSGRPDVGAGGELAEGRSAPEKATAEGGAPD